jgi:hypothetical protein
VDDLAGLRTHARQQRRGGPFDQGRRVPRAVGEERAGAGAVPGGRRDGREVRQLRGPQVDEQPDDETPEVTELVVGESGAQWPEEALQGRREAGDNHGTALPGSGDFVGKQITSLGRPSFMRQRRKWRGAAQFE